VALFSAATPAARSEVEGLRAGASTSAGNLAPIALRFDTCPQADPAYSTIRADFQIRRDGTLVDSITCTEPASQMPLSTYTDELMALQVLRMAYYMDLGRSNYLPWTPLRFYDWLKTKIGGVNVSTTPTNPYCCAQYGGRLFMVVGVTQDDGNRAYKLSFKGVAANLALFGHEARHVDGFPHDSGCGITGGCDATYDESNLSPYGIQYWLFRAWLNGTINLGFSCLPAPQPSDIANWFLSAANGYLSRFDNVKPPAVTMPAQPGGACSYHPFTSGIFRSGFFWLLDADGNQQFNSPPDKAFAFGGIPGDIPITGDWNGSGTTKVGVYRSSNGLFILDYDGDGQLTAADKVYSFGVGTQPGDIPVVGDWNGDGRSKIGLFRQGFFWILDTNGNGTFDAGDQSFAYGGVPGDVPIVGDWNGSGTSKVGVFRAGFLWILDTNGNHTVDAGDQIFPFGGVPGDVPVVGDWNGDGRTKVGVFRMGFFWVLDTNGNQTFDAGTDQAFAFGGVSGDKPLVGRW